METEPIEIYSHATNSCIVRMPERNHPGVVVQGDSLAALFSSALKLVERLEGNTDIEALLGALEIAQTLEAHLVHYEMVLQNHNMRLPYIRDASRNTERFNKYWNDKDV